MSALAAPRQSWRHHPADTLSCRLLLAVVRSQISSTPSADGASAAPLVLQNFISLEAVDGQLSRMVAGPIAFALAETIDEQLANGVIAN
jgi:hypothetical protein